MLLTSVKIFEFDAPWCYNNSMDIIGGKKLNNLANSLNKPLYVVGGAVRNFFIDGKVSGDIDLCAPIDTDTFVDALNKTGFTVIAEYKRTGTVLFSDGERKYEFTSFRTEKYKGGEHTPYTVEFTQEIKKDALRRDFKCNAIYYNLKENKIEDVLCGIKDVQNKILDTVDLPEKVFGSDGLRLMRLARFAGELGFKPTRRVINVAKRNAENICDISAERIYAELKLILGADAKYTFSKHNGHCVALKILQRIGFFEQIFGNFDIFSAENYGQIKYKTLQFVSVELRLACLLLSKDVNKVKSVLDKLKVSNNEKEKVLFILNHLNFDKNVEQTESDLRQFIVKNYGENLFDLLRVKDAVYTALTNGRILKRSIERVRWEKLIEKMKKDRTPFTIKQLQISAQELSEIGYKGKNLGEELKILFDFAVVNPDKNDKKTLINIAASHFKRKI